MNDFYSCIYKITCKDNDNTDFYIGSSTNWEVRKKFHKYHSQNSFNRPLYKWINKNGGYDNFNFEPIAWFKCGKEELREHEEMFFKTLNPTINVYHPKRDKRQYFLDNREKIKEQSKEYYEKNKEQILFRATMKMLCPVCGEWATYAHMARHQKTQRCKILGSTLLENECIKIL